MNGIGASPVTAPAEVEWTPEALHAFDPRFLPEMAALMNPQEGMKTRTAPGGTTPATVRAALNEASERLEALSR